MAHIIKFGEHTGLAGLVWKRREAAYTASTLREDAKEGGHDHAIVLAESPFDRKSAGFLRAVDAGGRVGLPVLSAAIAGAAVGKLLVLPVQDADSDAELYWLIGASDEGVTAGTDYVGSLSQVEAELKQVLLYTKDAVVCGPASVAAALQPLTVKPLDPSELAAGLSVRRYKLQRLQSNTRSYMLAGVALVAVVGMGFVLKQKLFPPPPPPKPYVHPGLTPEQQEQVRRADYVKGAVTQVNAILPQASSAWAHKVLTFVYNLPIADAGFRMKEARCSGEQCAFVYEKVGAAFIYEFEKRMSAVTNRVDFAMDGSSARFVVTLPVDDKAIASSRGESFLREAPMLDAFRKEWIDRFNGMENAAVVGWSYQVDEPAPVLEPVPDGEPRLTTSGFTVTVSDIWLLEHVLRLLDNPHVNVKSISFSIEGDNATAVVSGAFVART